MVLGKTKGSLFIMPISADLAVARMDLLLLRKQCELRKCHLMAKLCHLLAGGRN